ncbi:thiamine pyrophosphate-binding protein [Aestuariivita sp.]|jgi:acetolactate synthase-1/2/3 large subunit/sulfoacetaldehyde acetyltransferase|uniref:thiamine pyrophosphate-binding protein n=1 Tax=Aestuariivita sp. TaxID=1872407 RepID=UPI0025C700AA|nr:thiamine pyrophosphate-binding protein [Aestuariivita sp.]
MEMFDTLYEAREITLIGVHDERTGSIWHGYARASGRTGVVLAGQNGPGATNLVTGLDQAKAAYTPLVSIAGALASGHVYRDAFQELDQQALFTPVTKKTWTATSADQVPEMMREAFRVAHTPRKGPTQLNPPRDVLSGQADFGPMQTPETYRPVTAMAATAQTIAKAARMLAEATRPVIMVGGATKTTGTGDNAMALAEAFNTPVVSSPGHGDAVPFGHPLNADHMGPRGNPVATRLVKEADVILGLGTRNGFNATFHSYDNINRDAQIIHVEQEPTAIGRYFPLTMGILADAPTVADQLVAEAKTLGRRAEADSWTETYRSERHAYLAKRDADAQVDILPIQPSGLFKTLQDVLPKDAAVTMDAGTLCLQATDALSYWHPQRLFTPLDFGLVGFSFAAGLGVKLAMPDRPVISLMGDGGFGMTVSELSTAVDHNINSVTVVMNNGCWGAEKAYQRDCFAERYIGADISSPPFDTLAELYGAKGYRAQTLAEMAEP